METKILQIFYGADNLPYKDKERQVHFPITGQSFSGASLTTEIRFYTKEIGGVNDITWVANAKRPDGKIAYQQLESNYDSEVEESYVSLQLSQWFTEKKGDLFIALNGYAGGVDIQVDEDSGLYTVSGTPIIQATGSIKVIIAYAPIMNNGYGAVPEITVQEALGAVANKLDKQNTPRTVYGVNADSEQVMLPYSLQATPSTLARRDLAGQINVPLTPTDNSNATSKGYVDSFGKSIELTMDSEYKLYLTLKDANGNVLGTTQVVDLPLESVVVGGSYDSVNKALVLILDNGETISIPVGNLIDGLVSEEQLENALATKQDTLVSGTNIKTIVGESLLGSGDTKLNNYTKDVLSQIYTGKSVNPQFLNLEQGNIGISSSGWTYTNVDSNKRIRTPENFILKLNVGDKVYLTDYTKARLYIGYKFGALEQYGYQGWITSGEFVAQTPCEICILVATVGDATITSVNDLSQYLVVEIRERAINNINKEIETTGELQNELDNLIFQNKLCLGFWNGSYTGINISSSRIVPTEILVYNYDVVISWDSTIDLALHIFDSKTYSISNRLIDTGYYTNVYSVFIPKGTYFLFIAKLNNGSNFVAGDISKFCIKRVEKSFNKINYFNTPILSINHRGYNSVAPENTLPAYRLSKQNGFDIVECDVLWTSDNIPVLLHDDTINRTARNSDGTPISSTIYIGQITYAQALEYDFGVWKSSVYAGTKIPTFEQFITLCKNINLSAYIEIKDNGTWTKEKLQNIVNIVKANGMNDKVSYISFSTTALKTIVEIDETARVGFITMNNDHTYDIWGTLFKLNTGKNEVFIDVYRPRINTNNLNLAKSLNLKYEAYDFNTELDITSASSYITGFTSDSLIASKVIYDSNIGDSNGNE